MIETMKAIRSVLVFFMKPFVNALLLVLLAMCAIVVRLRQKEELQPSLVWGCSPLISNKYWSLSMRRKGFRSETYVHDYYSVINKRDDFDRVLSECFGRLPYFVKQYLAFCESLFKYDVFFLSFDGYFLGSTKIWWLEPYLLSFARKKTVLIPYGGDSYVYRNIKRPALIHGLMMSYPGSSRRQRLIAKRVALWTDLADCVVPGIMGPDGFGRWDALLPSFIFIDAGEWRETERRSNADGVNDIVRIAHAPNHRGFKGTEFVCSSVEQLKAEGLKVELVLIEKMQNSEVKRLLADEVDILVEALVCTGHGLNGLEGMATGLPVITNLEDDSYTEPFRVWSYLDECPILSASPENIKERLRHLVTNPSLRHALGGAGRSYVEKYQDLEASHHLFSAILDFVYERRGSIASLYHPLVSDFVSRRPRISHPLVKNRIV